MSAGENNQLENNKKSDCQVEIENISPSARRELLRYVNFISADMSTEQGWVINNK